MRFTYDQLPGTVVFGRGAAQSELAAQFDALGLHNVMLVAGGSTLAEARRLTSEVDDRIGSVFTNVLPHVPTAVADEARAKALASGADGLLSVGGGSTTGTAKIVALTTNLPIIAIPTTYAGSEMTPVWGLTTDARKETGIDRAVLPRTVIYDSTLTRTLPVALAIASGFNALAHCVEAFWGPAANPVTSLHAGAGIRALAEGMRGVHGGAPTDDDYDQLLYGAYLAGSSFAVAGSGLHHKICHALGGAFNLPHAETHAVILPHVLAFNAGSIGADAEAIAAAFGAPDGADAAAFGTAAADAGTPGGASRTPAGTFGTPAAGVRGADAAGALWRLGRELDSPDSLEALGLKASQLDEAIAIVSSKLPIANPRLVTPDDIATILTAAFSSARGR